MTRGRAGILSGTPSLSSALVEEFWGRRIGEAVVDSRLERQARNESLIREMNERIEQLDRVAKQDSRASTSSLNFSASAVQVTGGRRLRGADRDDRGRVRGSSTAGSAGWIPRARTGVASYRNACERAG